MIELIHPNWPAPNNVRGLTTTRVGGVSLSPFDTLNMGSRTGDSLDDIIKNRQRVIEAVSISNEPYWLYQTHSTIALDISNIKCKKASGMPEPINVEADASYTRQARQVSVVLTADCLPVLFCSKMGNEVAAAHAGWRGLCNGILEETIKHFTCSHSDIFAWLGPAIGPTKFEVGHEVKAQFESIDSNAEKAFTLINSKQKKYLADLYLIAKQRLSGIGISQIYGGDYCTYSQADKFYSYRRENQTGRMASMIWFE